MRLKRLKRANLSTSTSYTALPVWPRMLTQNIRYKSSRESPWGSTHPLGHPQECGQPRMNSRANRLNGRTSGNPQGEKTTPRPKTSLPKCDGLLLKKSNLAWSRDLIPKPKLPRSVVATLKNFAPDHSRPLTRGTRSGLFTMEVGGAPTRRSSRTQWRRQQPPRSWTVCRPFTGLNIPSRIPTSRWPMAPYLVGILLDQPLRGQC